MPVRAWPWSPLTIDMGSIPVETTTFNLKNFKMACDIHIHSEVKIRGVWHHHCEINMVANYAMFAKMCGVRNWEGSGIVPLSEPKCLPDDITLLTRLHLDKWQDNDGHSASWLGREEIFGLFSFIEKDEVNFGEYFVERNFPYLFDGPLHAFKERKPKIIEDVRIVFIFDN